MKVINKIKYFSVLLVFLSMLGSNAKADVVYSTFESGQTYYEDAWWSLGTVREQQVAVSFTPTNDFENITFTFAASNVNNDTQGVKISLTTGASIPDTSSTIETVDAIVTSDLPALYNVSFASDLLMGTKYWMVLTAPDPDPNDSLYPNLNWYESYSAVGNVAGNNSFTGFQWIALSSETPAFEVTGIIKGSTPVPEPASLLLFCSGLVGLFAGRRMFKQ